MPPMDQPPSLDSGTMSFGDHLDELRSRVFRAIIVPLPLSILTYFVSSWILELLIAPLRAALRAQGLPESLQVLGPTEALMTQIKISLLVALALSMPWILWQVWQFIRPGLYSHERRFVYFLIPGSAILTATGIALLYFVMLPIVLIVLVDFGTVLDRELTYEDLRQSIPDSYVEPTTPVWQIPFRPYPPEHIQFGDAWINPRNEIVVVVPTDPSMVSDRAAPLSVGEFELRRLPLHKQVALTQQFQLKAYIGFVLLLGLGMIVGFQTPLVMLLLGWLDLMRVDFLKKNRRKALFILAVISAIITPADPWSMLTMLIPLYLLFELGIFLMVAFPAKRVSEGRLWPWTRSDKRSRQSAQSSQMETRDATSEASAIDHEDSTENKPRQDKDSS